MCTPHDRYVGRLADWYVGRQTVRHTFVLMDGHEDRQTDRQTDRHSDM